jgi:glycerophosphoryl diester phosphodiesterase
MPFPLIAAHRGGAGLWPENSLTAFRNAIRLPVDLIEFDVHRSKDGLLVVHHDATLDRTTDGEGALADKTWDELCSVTVKGTDGEPLPLLDELIALIKPTGIDLRLEFKCRADGSRYPGLEAEVIAELRAADMLRRTIFTSFEWDTLEKALSLASVRGAIALMRKDVIAEPDDYAAALALVQAKALPEIALPAALMTADRLAQARDMGLRAGAFGINDEELIAAAFDLGATAFTTDRPDLALAERDKRVCEEKMLS